MPRAHACVLTRTHTFLHTLQEPALADCAGVGAAVHAGIGYAGPAGGGQGGGMRRGGGGAGAGACGGACAGAGAGAGATAGASPIIVLHQHIGLIATMAMSRVKAPLRGSGSITTI